MIIWLIIFTNKILTVFYFDRFLNLIFTYDGKAEFSATIAQVISVS